LSGDRTLRGLILLENCSVCGEPCNDYNYILDHTTGYYGHETDPTIVREGVFCSIKCLLSWVLKEAAKIEGGGSRRRISEEGYL